jgi:predicted transcriptional regulator
MTDTEILREHVKQYIDRADEKSLRLVQAILEIEEGEDWWDELPKEIRNLLETSISDGDAGKGIPHEEMVKKYSQWFKM